MLHGLRRALAFLTAAAIVLASSTATATLKISWDCYLPGASVDCSVIEGSLTSKIPFLKVVADPRAADVIVSLTSVPAENATRFELHFIGKRVDGDAIEVRTNDKIPWSIDTATSAVRLLTKLERGLDDFMDQKIASEVRDGTLDIEVIDPVRMPYTGRPEQNGVDWYVAPMLGTYVSDVEGIGINASGTASLSFNLSRPTWRLQQWIGANYNQQSQPVPGTTETASVSFAGANANDVLSWSLSSDNRWSLGLLLAAEKNPQANYTMRANGSAGIEYDLVPRQTVNQKNFGMRCAAGPEFQRYDATNIEGVNHQVVGRQFCDIFLSWHFTPTDVWASIGETSILKDPRYRSFSGTISATWRVTDNITVSPWVSVQQINSAINEARPANVVYSDPLQEVEASMLAAVEQGYTSPFGIQSGLSVRYLFGNGSLSSEDQRWKNTSNLR